MKGVTGDQIIKTVIATTLVISGANLLGRLTQKTPSGSLPIDKGLLQAVNKINKNCPIILDNITKFDNAMINSGKSIQFNYTLNVDRGAH